MTASTDRALGFEPRTHAGLGRPLLFGTFSLLLWLAGAAATLPLDDEQEPARSMTEWVPTD